MKKYIKYLLIIISFLVGLIFIGNHNIKVHAEEVTELTIELLGEETIYLIPNSEYVEWGAKAYDPIDGDISEDIVINSSAINNTVEGTYRVSYTITNSSSETKIIYRNVIVDDNYQIKRHVINPGYSRPSNEWNKMTVTSDGGFVAVGNYCSYDYYDSRIALIHKYDSSMNLEWSATYKYNSDSSTSSRCKNDFIDFFEDNNKYILLNYNSSYGFSSVLIYDKDGTKLAEQVFNSSYQYIKRVEENKYILIKDGSKTYYLMEYSDESKTFTYDYYEFDYGYSGGYGAFVHMSKLYYKYNDKIVSYDINNDRSEYVSDETISYLYNDDDYIYALYPNNYILIFDYDFNMLTKIETDISQEILTSNDRFLIGQKNGTDKEVVYIDKTTFEEVIRYKVDVSDFYVLRGRIVDAENKIYFYGSQTNYYLYIKEIDPTTSINGLEDETHSLNTILDFSNMLSILNTNSIYYIQNIDSSEFDSTKAGIYNVYFTVKYIDEENIKTIQASKQITIEHQTSIENGQTYEGFITIDVEGADVIINGKTYEYGDIYNVPGQSTMLIIGENGYQKEISFTINPTIIGIEDNGIYYESVFPNISGGNLSLNGEIYNNGSEISYKGNYFLEITNSLFAVKNDSTYPFVYFNGVFQSSNKQGHPDSVLIFNILVDGELSFYYWVSSENNFDYLTIYYNENQIIRISGSSSQTYYSLNVKRGDVIKCEYSHDGSQSSGSDAAFIKPIISSSQYYQSVSFTIEPTITGVANGQTYYETIYPQINAENMTLNGEVYNNEPIVKCGNYELVITGVGGYVKTLNFVIETVVEGLEDEGTYTASVIPTFTKGTATLNGEEYLSGTTITTPGYNTLIITGGDGYSVEYNFTINETIEGIENSSVYFGSVTPIISGGILKLNGADYTSNTAIDVPGNYTLEINGADGYYKRLIFIVRPESVNVVNGQTYTHSVIPAVSKGELTLNGEEYISGTVLNVSGDYKLQIIGENGYFETINFTLKTGANVEDGATYINEHTLHFIGDATLNGETVLPGTLINEVGNYFLELVDGSNTYTYNFVIEPDYSIFDNEINNEFTLEYINANVKLNEESYISNTIVSEVGKYVLKVDGVNGYSKTYNFDINAYSNIKNDDEFIDSVEVEVIGGSFKIDDVEYTEKVTVDAIGNHTITIVGLNGYKKTINFVINPAITGVEDFGYYFNAITPTINSINVTLDGNEYISGNEISIEGVHSLVIAGLNEYEKTINFIILPTDFSVKPNEYYDNAISINSCDAEIEIDDSIYTLGQEITEYGIHEIKLKYNGGYSYYSFYVLPFVEGVVDGEEYEESVVINTNYPYLLLNNNPYTSGEVITEIGNHVFVVKNLDGYDHTITFTIKEKYDGVEDGGVYTESIKPTIPNGTLTLDGNVFTSGTEIKAVGNHNLTISGLNGYENTISFTIVENTGDFENDGEYKGSVVITIPNATLKLDGNSFTSGTTVSSVGNHTLTVCGTNDYEVNYNFTITPNVYFNVNGSYVSFEEGKTYENASYIRVEVSNVQSILLNDSSYSSDTSIYNIGNHNVKIYGTNDYVYEMNFTKEAMFSGVTDGGEYSSYTTVTCNYAQKMELNGESFASGTRLLIIGNHNLKVYGVGDYEKEISFVIKPYFYNYYSVDMSSTGGTRTCTDGVRFRIWNSYNSNLLNSQYYEKIEIDGELYTNESYYYNVGNHKLVVYGVNDYTFEVDFILTTKVSNISEGKESTAFTPIIYLSSSNSYTDEYRYVLLDGEEYTLNTLITEVGNHTLSIFGSNDYLKEYNFTVLPTVSGLKNDETYYESVTPIIEYCELLLDDDEYISGTKITKVGNHILTVKGSNDYTKQYAFTITPVNVSKYENKTFTKELVIEDVLDCQLKINGYEYNLGDKIVSIGNNVLDIYGTNGYEYQLNFTLIEDPILYTEEGNLDFTNKFVANRMVKINIPNAILTIDGEEYISGTEYLVVGKHYLSIEGLNGYSKQYEFTINDKVYGLENGMTYEYLTIVCDNAQKLILNTVEIESGHLVNNVGSYTLVVEGTNGYVNSYSFTINSKTSGIENGGIYTGIVSPVFNSNSVTLDGKQYVSGTAINEVGNHTIVVNGADGYQETITFTIKETINGLVNGEVYNDILNINITGKCNSIKLNNKTVSNNFMAKQVGHNYLVITGVNGYECSYSFDIEPIIEGVINGENYTNEVNIKVNGDCSGIKLNGTLVDSTCNVNTFGTNTLEIIGINNYSKVITFNLIPTITGIETGDVFDEKATVSINLYPKSVKLNGQVLDLDSIVNNTVVINSVGNNKITFESIDGSLIEKQFVIKPVISNIVEGGVYTGSVTPNIKGLLVDYQLNEEPISINSTIDKVGYNTLKIVGVNGYEERINFTLEIELMNYPTTDIYKFDPIFIGTGKVYLNGQLIANDTKTIPTINTFGENKIKVVGNNGYYKEFSIILNPKIEGVVDGDSKTKFNINVLSECLVMIDDSVKENEIKDYKEIGNHTLRVIGANDYSYSLEFTVVEDYIIEDTYIDSFKLSYTSGSILIDGSKYYSNQLYSKVGNHIVKVTGSNGYYNEYNICIVPNVKGIADSKEYNNSVTFTVLSGNVIYVDDVKYSNTCTINSIGNHTLKIIGSNNYVYTYEFVVLESHSLTSDLYENKVTINISNTYTSMKLDGKTITNNYLCETLGNHELIIYGSNGYSNTYEFAITPSIEELENGGVYNGSVTWKIGGSANIDVDGKSYNTEETFSLVGNHTMKIYTDYGYEKIIDFTIKPSISGVVADKTYTNSVSISIPNCQLILNGVTQSKNSLTVSKIGNHELVIKGTNDYTQIVNFVIKEKDICFQNGSSYNSLKLTGFENCDITLDGQPFENNSIVSAPGKHILIIHGVNDYSSEYTFNINFTMTTTNNKINTNGGQIFVNGEEVEQGYVVKTIGYNKIQLVGANGYTEEKEIFIKENMDISSGEVYKHRVLIKKINAQVFIDGVEIFEDTYVEEAGKHTIKIIGAGNYEKNINIEVENPNITYTIIATSVVSVCLLGFGLLLIRRKRVI